MRYEKFFTKEEFEKFSKNEILWACIVRLDLESQFAKLIEYLKGEN